MSGVASNPDSPAVPLPAPPLADAPGKRGSRTIQSPELRRLRFTLPVATGSWQCVDSPVLFSFDPARRWSKHMPLANGVIRGPNWCTLIRI